MIENKTQYTLTMAQAAVFKKSIEDLTLQGSSDGVDPVLHDAEIRGMKSVLDELEGEIAEYENHNRH